MKRIAIAAATVAVMLIAAGSAFAAVNSYTATTKFRGGRGTAAKPAAVSFSQTINVTAGTAGSRTGLLHTINETIDGVRLEASNAKGDKCTATQINNASNDSGCPKSALIATGSIKALLGPITPFTTAAAIGTCDPEIDVWNGGPGKLVFFFLDTASHACLGGSVHTGVVAPFPATYKEAGHNLDVTIPIPMTVDEPLGPTANLYGSLSYDQLNWKSQKINGKPDIESTGCSGSKRKYGFGFNASLPDMAPETVKTTGSATCG